MLRFLDEAAPVIIVAMPLAYDKESVQKLITGYERLFDREQKYALLTVMPAGGETPDAKTRKQIADWANLPRSNRLTSKLCVGSATLLTNALFRGALTAMYWLYKPPCPQRASPNLDDALTWLTERCVAEKVAMPLTGATLRASVRASIEKYEREASVRLACGTADR